MHVATSKGLLDCVMTLLKAKSDVNAPDEKGKAPIHHAAASCKAEACALLIKNEVGTIPPPRLAPGRQPSSHSESQP